MIGTGLLAAAAVAQEPGDATQGQHLARTWCAACHMVEAAQRDGGATGIPTFAAIARMPSTTALSLHAFLQTTHGRMPDFQLSRDEINDVSAYILSLKGK
jgi:mono/diheme cytochrome c family protein